ncbi:MAG: phosphotransferase [Bacteroidetes bacterium]|nr:phosphotransferase [Bacteroidota bacterium]
MVVVSRQSACVIKRLRTPSSEARCTSEKNASDRAHDAGLETHIPTVYAHGTHASGGHYLHTSLAPNTRPFFERRRTYWRRWLASEGLPVLEQFYDAAGVRERPADALLVAAEHAISSSGAPDALHRLLECTRRARPQGQHAIVPYALTHGDLNPVHIHRSRSSWVLIDWGVMTYRPIWQELLLPYLRHPLDTQYGRADFWAWLRGETAPPELQANVRADLNLYIEWLRRWRNENVSLAELRYQILAVWLNLLTSRVQSSEKLQSCLQESPLDDLIGHPNVAIRHTAQTLRALGLTTIEGDT